MFITVCSKAKINVSVLHCTLKLNEDIYITTFKGQIDTICGHKMMNLSLIILYILLLRIYSVTALKDNDLVIHKSSYGKMRVKNWNVHHSKTANRSFKLSVESGVESTDAKPDQPKNGPVSKEFIKGK